MPKIQPNANPYGTPANYGYPPWPAPESPQSMSRPLRVLGIIYIVLGCLAVLAAVAMIAASFLAFDSPGDDKLGLGGLYLGAALIAVVGAFQILAGFGLRRFRPWGRTVGIIQAILYIFGFPLGTILGGYTLSLLLKNGAREEYAMLSDVLGGN